MNIITRFIALVGGFMIIGIFATIFQGRDQRQNLVFVRDTLSL